MSSLGKCERTFAATSFDKRVRESNIVKTIVERFRFGLRRFFTTEYVSSS